MRGKETGLLNVTLAEAHCDEAATLLTADCKLAARLAGTTFAEIAQVFIEQGILTRGSP